MNGLVMVAHPDDCVIFAYGFINQYKNINWSICYLTHKKTDRRAIEISDFWTKRNIHTKFLGFVDNVKDLNDGAISQFNVLDAASAIKTEIADYDLILTHGSLGEYGHPHHIFVNNVVCSNHQQVVTFAKSHKGNVRYTVNPDLYRPEELPLHYNVIRMVHKDAHINDYHVPVDLINIL